MALRVSNGSFKQGRDVGARKNCDFGYTDLKLNILSLGENQFLFISATLKHIYFFLCYSLEVVFLLKHSSIINAKKYQYLELGFPSGSVLKNSPANVGASGSIPDLEKSPGEGNGNPHQYSCQENPMDRGAWRATVHGVAKSWT